MKRDRTGEDERRQAREAAEDAERNERLRRTEPPTRPLCPSGCSCLLCQLTERDEGCSTRFGHRLRFATTTRDPPRGAD